MNTEKNYYSISNIVNKLNYNEKILKRRKEKNKKKTIKIIRRQKTSNDTEYIKKFIKRKNLILTTINELILHIRNQNNPLINFYSSYDNNFKISNIYCNNSIDNKKNHTCTTIITNYNAWKDNSVQDINNLVNYDFYNLFYLFDKIDVTNKNPQILIFTKDVITGIYLKYNINFFNKRKNINSFVYNFNYENNINLLEKHILIGMPDKLLSIFNLLDLKHIKIILIDDIYNIFNKIFPYIDVFSSLENDTKIIVPPMKVFDRDILINFLKFYPNKKLYQLKIIKHINILVSHIKRSITLTKILSNIKFNQVIIYIEVYKNFKNINNALLLAGFKDIVSLVSSSDKNSSYKISNFNSGKTQILITNEIFSPKLIKNNVSLIINYDMPDILEHYILRIGESTTSFLEKKIINFINKKDNLKIIENIEKKYLISNIENYGDFINTYLKDVKE